MLATGSNSLGNMFVPINVIKLILVTGAGSRTFRKEANLGIGIISTTSMAFVSKTADAGPSAKCVSNGDIIVWFCNKPVKDQMDLPKVAGNGGPGTEISWGFQFGGP